MNCHRNYPWYKGWQDEFSDQQLTFIGVHTPETDAERSVETRRRKTQEAGFSFPVVADNSKQIWNDWGNSMWPTVYLIDKRPPPSFDGPVPVRIHSVRR